MTDTTREELARTIHMRLLAETEEIQRERLESFVREDTPAGKLSQKQVKRSDRIHAGNRVKAPPEAASLLPILED